jgi:hypothetical protein
VRSKVAQLVHRRLQQPSTIQRPCRA